LDGSKLKREDDIQLLNPVSTGENLYLWTAVLSGMEIWLGFSERRVFAEITVALGSVSIGAGFVAAWGRPNAGRRGRANPALPYKGKFRGERK